MKCLAHSHRPYVCHHAVKQLFRKVYYARRSCRSAKEWADGTFPEYIKRSALRRIDGTLDFLIENPDAYDSHMAQKSMQDIENDGVKRWPSGVLVTPLNCQGFKHRKDIPKSPPPPRPVPINETDPFGKPTLWESIKKWFNPTQRSN